MEEIFKLLEAGGNGAVVFIAWLLWKFDRRIYRLELTQNELVQNMVKIMQKVYGVKDANQ